MKKPVLVTGIVSLTLLLLAVLFKMAHYPGASAMLILGVAILNLIYLPLLLIHVMQQKETAVLLKVAQGIGILPAWMLTFGMLFKIQHWPGAFILLYFGMIILLVIFLPLFITGLVKNKANEHPGSSVRLLTLSLFGILILGYAGTKPPLRMVEQDISAERNVTYSMRLLKLNTATITTGLQRCLVENEAGDKDLYIKAMTISAKAKELTQYLDHLRNELIMHEEAMTESAADTLPMSRIKYPDDYDTPTHFLVGSDPNNLTGEAKELHQKMEAYITHINSSLDKQLPPNMLTPDGHNASGEKVSWEVSNFYHTSLSGCLVIFKSLQLQLEALEENQLLDILNRMQEINSRKK
ncbi:MAG TPA: hypothetical protein VNZ86_10740 [Bacteroidia bacterium]|jgi:hypothetical protein|nr:hypothetical protein [Bacteroidia bacterium]